MPEPDIPTTILTLQLDTDSQAFFEGLRQTYFPPERNQVPAHLTLFHQLPETAEVRAILQHAAARQSAFALEVTGLRFLGRGVAYELTSPILLDLHRRLQVAFGGYLTAQDKQRFAPHVVVQNKVTPEAGRALLWELRQKPLPGKGMGCGLDLWRYLGGPWDHLETFAFRKQ
jgi:hypothetical protein